MRLLLIVAVSLLAASSTYATPPCATLTGANATVIVPGGASAETILLVESFDGLCAGNATLTGEDMAFPLWSDNPTTAETDGLISGESFVFRTSTGTLLVPTFSDAGPGSMLESVYVSDSFYYVSSLVSSQSQFAFAAGPHAVSSGTVTIPMHLTLDVGPLGGLQFDLATSGSVEIEAVNYSGAGSFTFVTSPVGQNALRILAYNGSLPVGSYNGLFTVELTVTGLGVVTANGLVSTLDSPDGSDAGVAFGKRTVSFSSDTPYGDQNADGSINVIDLVQAVDILLDDGGSANDAADLFPFPAGDATVDVRDLEVLSEAIASGVWPNGIPISGLIGTRPSSPTTPGSARGMAVVVEVGSSVTVSAAVPIRAIQVDIVTTGLFEVVPEAGVAVVVSEVVTSPGTFRVLAYRLDSVPLPEVPFVIATAEMPAQFSGGLAVGIDGNEVPVTEGIATGAEDEATSPSFAVSAPYPNPFVGAATMEIALTEAVSLEVDLYNALGRHIAALVRGPHRQGVHRVHIADDGLAAGVYFVRVRAGEDTETIRMTLAR